MPCVSFFFYHLTYLILCYRPILLPFNGCSTTRHTISAVRLSAIHTSIYLTPFTDQWMIVMSTQLIGFSIGGITRRFLVQPPSMSTFPPLFSSPLAHLRTPCTVWPANLVTCALFNTLHSQNYAGIGSRSGMSRERFFFISFTLGVIWCMVHFPFFSFCF
jgi:hypothetical protein